MTFLPSSRQASPERAGTPPAETASGLRPVIGFANQPRIATPRLDLRKPMVGDSVALARGLSDPLVSRMLLPLPQPYHPGDALDWVLGWTDGASTGWVFAITLRHDAARPGVPGDSEVLGIVTLETGPAQVELGYWLARPFWRQGIMSEAVSAVLTSFFDAAPQGRVHSGVIADNPVSLRLQDRLGFAVTGVRDAWCRPRSAMVSVIATDVSASGFTPI